MIAAAAICPQPAGLLREYRSTADPFASLRETCREAVSLVLGAEPRRLVVVGAGPGPEARHTTRDPLSVRVARELLEGLDAPSVQEVVVAPDETRDAAACLGRQLCELPGDTALLVIADGSARRGVKAPGYLDERAFAYDDRWRAALRDGDVDELRALEPELAADLLARGRAPLQVLAGAVGESRVQSTVLLDEDRWGVAYLVGVWSCG
ncbi:MULTISPECIES: hypothetical protein [Arsenicicoccus]|uniref:hypothetical protein n=1 Tax=Arsenicicoccus TaxID=267408 RepID=UPI00257AF784|nr:MULTISPECIES: hypothetical protein [Arsenicicoccus]